MTPRVPLELLPAMEQVKKLCAFLASRRSPLRPHLALFAIKNYLLRDAGQIAGAAPTVKWYQRRLMQVGIRASIWSVREQLNKLAKFGALDKGFARKNRKGCCHPMLVGTCHYHLNEAVYPALEEALRRSMKRQKYGKVQPQQK